ncbi:MAG: putative transposase, partial [Streptomycetaceae bacterium]|nr:putative transposase [Streptomycetaceae bacterium]
MAVRQQRRTRSDAGERPWTDAQPASRAFCQRFFTYYNTVHRHSGIGLHTPASVHDGTAEAIHAQRAA